LNSKEIITLAKEVISQETAAAAAIADQVDESMVRAAELMLACTGHVLVAGSGTSHLVGARLAHLLSCCGTPSLFIDPGDAQHGLSGAVMGSDVLIAISKGGTTTEVNHLAHFAKQRGAKVIALTEKPDSPLGQISDVVLKVVSPVEVDPYGMIATGSSLINSTFCDALCVVMLKLRGYSKEEFAKTHPGGAVGIQLKKDNILLNEIGGRK